MLKNTYLVSSVLACAMFCAGSAQAEKTIGSSAQPISLSISIDNTWTNPLSIDSVNSYVTSGHITGYTITGSAPSYIQDYPSALYQYVSAGIYTPLNAFISVTQFSTEAGQPMIGQFAYTDGTSTCTITYNFDQIAATPIATATAAGSFGPDTGCAVTSSRSGNIAALNVRMTTQGSIP